MRALETLNTRKPLVSLSVPDLAGLGLNPWDFLACDTLNSHEWAESSSTSSQYLEGGVENAIYDNILGQAVTRILPFGKA
jgi:hypothetical protein